jgi:hypothetical protein
MPGHVVWRGCNQPLLPGSPPVSVVQEQQGLADEENVVKVTDVACHILQCKVDKPFVSARVWVYGTRSTCLISTDEGTLGAA